MLRDRLDTFRLLAQTAKL